MFVNAYTARGASTRRTSEPVLHASHHPPVPTSPTASTYRALCGRSVRNVTTVAWDPRGPGRLCPECVNDVLRRDDTPAPEL